MKRRLSVIFLWASLSLVSGGCNSEKLDDVGSQDVDRQLEEVVQEEEVVDDMPDILTGIFEYDIDHDGEIWSNYIHFYENGVFYYSKYNNGISFAGYYEVEAGDAEIYSTGPVSASRYNEVVTCPYKITFYDIDGTTIAGEAGYDGEGMLIGVGIHDWHDFEQNRESEHKMSEETEVMLAEFQVAGDETRSVAIYHNGTFYDSINEEIKGTWDKTESGYVLQNEAADSTRTVEIRSDGTGSYIGEDAEEIALAAAELELLFPEYKKPKMAANYPPEENQGKILLVGSSFMENWETHAEDLAELDTLNLAIGGTVVSTWQDKYQELIVPYHPHAVVIYVGSNDINGAANSKNGDEVFEEIKVLFTDISDELKDTPIFYVSIAPTPAREHVWEDSARCNELMAEYCEQNENYYFIDCTDALLQEDASLREDIYIDDRLHFNEEGYKIWAAVIQNYLYEFFGIVQEF